MTGTIDRYITAQVTFWKKQREQLHEPIKSNKLPFITISREYGCNGYQIAEKIVEILNSQNPNPPWAAYNKNLLEKLMQDTGLSSSLIETLTSQARNKLTDMIQTSFSSFPPQVAIHKKLVETIATLALNGHVVLVGRGSTMITKNFSRGFHVRLIAPLNVRVEKISEEMKLSKQDAQKLIAEKTRQREEYMKEFFKIDITDIHNYDLTINDANFSVEETARLIIEAMKVKGYLLT
jgi:cytidylate kinase